MKLKTLMKKITYAIGLMACIFITGISLPINSSQAKTLILVYDAKIRPTPCSSASLAKANKGTNLKILQSATVFWGIVGTTWHKVSHSRVEGWVSDQNSTSPSKVKIDPTRKGKKCIYTIKKTK